MYPDDLLLDTHTFLWFMLDDVRLPEPLSAHLRKPTTRAVLSAVSCLEIAIKFKLGKLRIPALLALQVESVTEALSISRMNITFRHRQAAGALELHHRDPFDRLLIAQALIEGLPLASNEELFGNYGVERVW